MARLKLTFNDEHIQLIKNFRTRQMGDEYFAIDTYDLFGGTYLYEDMALILGYFDYKTHPNEEHRMDKVIPGTVEDGDGPKFDDDTLNHLNELDSFIVENLQNIEDILHQFCTEGIQPGVTYWCNPSEGIWHKEEKQ